MLILVKLGACSMLSCAEGSNIFLQLKKSYNIVAALKRLSGFSWDDDRGLNITINELSAWDEYIVVSIQP
jgi:hypothetical protein